MWKYFFISYKIGFLLTIKKDFLFYFCDWSFNQALIKMFFIQFLYIFLFLKLQNNQSSLFFFCLQVKL